MVTAIYENRGPVDCLSEIDTSAVAGKTVIITGGSSGLGFCYAKAFVETGAFVVIADLQPPTPAFKESQAVFVQCDVTVWHDQVNAFETAVKRSPNQKIDIVIANAGIAGPDVLEGLSDDVPQEPSTKIIDVNVTGILYTTKLAGWHFRRHHDDPLKGCLIFVSSIMGYIDSQSSSVYAASKFGVRGLMCCLRRKGVFRVNAIAPWLIATPIMRQGFLETVEKEFQTMDLDLAKTQDAVRAVLRIAADESINGRSLAIVPRQVSPSGYMDLNLDDFENGSTVDKLQKAVLSISYNKYGHAVGG
ncbi:hypothetical protein V502_03204 [Pseudogymnoascus sp. VKM F-4520 (FW-2644)]|nr:hypothetical protein V502_03204 [Pseudogymnoascus sp. VKM F-4520 (FW-2644)]